MLRKVLVHSVVHNHVAEHVAVHAVVHEGDREEDHEEDREVDHEVDHEADREVPVDVGRDVDEAALVERMLDLHEVPDHQAVLVEVLAVDHHVLVAGLLGLAVYSIQGEVELLLGRLEVHQGVRVGREEVPDQVDQVDHRGIAFQVVYADRGLVLEGPAEVGHQVH